MSPAGTVATMAAPPAGGTLAGSPSEAGGAAGAPPGGGQVVAPAPFTRAAREHVEGPFLDVSRLIGAATTDLPPTDVPAYGYYRHTVLLVEATGGTGGAAVAREDAPWIAIQSVLLKDVNGAPIVGPLDGYELFLVNKYGGYNFLSNPQQSPVFSAPSVDGNFAFLLRVPAEISNRDAYGALPNQNAASTYKLEITVNTSGNIFSTPPAGVLPTMRVRAYLEAWTQPDTADLRGNPQATTPPRLGSTSFWTRFQKVINPGQQTIVLPRVGNYLRNLVFIYRDDSSPAVRSTTEFPDPMSLFWDGRLVFNLNRLVWRHYISERYGFGGTAVVGNVQELDTGVFVYDFTHDLDGKPGGELRDLYWPTTPATRLELQGSFGGSGGTLTVLTNDVAPQQGDVYIT